MDCVFFVLKLPFDTNSVVCIMYAQHPLHIKLKLWDIVLLWLHGVDEITNQIVLSRMTNWLRSTQWLAPDTWYGKQHISCIGNSCFSNKHIPDSASKRLNTNCKLLALVVWNAVFHSIGCWNENGVTSAQICSDVRCSTTLMLIAPNYSSRATSWLRGAMAARSTPDRKVGGSIPSGVTVSFDNIAFLFLCTWLICFTTRPHWISPTANQTVVSSVFGAEMAAPVKPGPDSDPYYT